MVAFPASPTRGTDMPQNQPERRDDCPDCDRGGMSRRNFLWTTVGSAAAIAGASAGVLGIPSISPAAEAASPGKATSETLVGQLYKSPKEEQKKAICFPFDHAKRSDVDNNWF